MFGYFTDLEICLVSEKILLLVFQVIVLEERTILCALESSAH